MKKLLMAMILIVCATVGPAQGLPGRTLGRRLQRPVASAARRQELQKTTTNGVEWAYRIATCKNDGDVDEVVVLGGDSSPRCGAISKDVSGALDIPDSIAGMPVVVIWKYAFHSCFNLTSVTIPLSVKNIGDSAFANCTGLTSVTIPSSVKSIGPSAFSGCSGLTSVTIPPSVKSIGPSAFSGCSGLTMMKIPEGVTNIAGCAFLGCNKISSFVVSPENQYFASVNGLLCTKDGKRVIAGANGNVMIPKSVMEIGEGALSDCTSFVVSPENQHFSSVDGLLCSKDGKCVVVGVNGDVTIPKSATEIGENAFSDCKGLTSVVITPNVTNIGEMAFGPCDELTNVKFCGERPDCKEDVFFGCEKLKSIQVPAKCKSWAGMKEWQGRPLVFYGQNNAAVQAERHDHTDSQRWNTSGREGSMKNRRSSPVASAVQEQQLHTITTNDFKVKLTGVAIIGGGRMCGFFAKANKAEFKDPDRSFEIPYGKAACFRIEYDFPEGYHARVWVNVEERMRYYFGFNPSPLYTGKGVAYGFLDMLERGRTCTLEQLDISTAVEPELSGGPNRWCFPATPVHIKFLGPDSLAKKEVVDGYTWSYLVNEVGVTICAVSPKPIGNVSVPSVLEGVSVTKIRGETFCECSGMTSVTIPPSVKIVGRSAFENCSGLEELVVSEGVTNIEYSAFSGCSNLRSVKLPSSVKSICPGTFEGCSKIESVTIPPFVKEISDVFPSWGGFTNIKEVAICEGVTSVGRSMFHNLASLKSVTIPSSVMNIGSYAFSGCGGLTSLTIPSDLKNIDATAFSGCKNLKTVDVVKDGRVESLSFDVFRKRLNSVKANGVEWTYEVVNGGVVLGSGDRIVLHDQKAKLAVPRNTSGALIIPETLAGMSVRGIGIGAFSACSNLTSVTIPSGVTSIGKHAFAKCVGLTSVKIPSSVTSIGEGAFEGCVGLTSLTIPSSVASVGDSAFSECSGLKSFVVAPENSTYSSINGLLCSKDGRTLIQGVNGDVTIPLGITNVSAGAFWGCSELKSVMIPSSVVSIEEWAFGACSGLKSVTIPPSVVSIGDCAFAECRGLMSINVNLENPIYSSINGLLCSKDGCTLIQGVNGDVEIPMCVTNIGYMAFCGCKGLMSVTIPSSVTTIEGSAFSDCSGLTSVTIPPSVANWGKNARSGFGYGGVFDGCSGLKSVTILPGVMSIEASTFSGCSNLTSVTIPSTVTNIAYAAFHDCAVLKTVTIPSSVVNIDRWAFSGCGALSSFVVDPANPTYSSINGLLCSRDGRALVFGVNADMTIPSSVTNIEEGAFLNWDRTRSLAVDPDNPTYRSISGMLCSKDGCLLFRGVNVDVEIPPSVTNIAAGAFFGRSGLTSVTIPSSVKNIGRNAFSKTPFYENMPDGIVILGGGVLYKYKGKCPSSVEIPSGVTAIEEDAFSDRFERKPFNDSRFGELTFVTIPSSVRRIDRTAFSDCSKLTGFSVDANNKAYASVDGILYNKHQTDLIQCPTGKKGDVTIPAGVTCICGSAFFGCGEVVSVEIPSSVTNIGREAFSRCKELASLTIPSCVTNVHPSAFSGCSKLETVNIVKEGKVEPLSFDEFCERWNLTNPSMNWRRRNRRPARSTSRTVVATNGVDSTTKDERAERRRQLLAIQEELSRVRGAKSVSAQNARATGGGSASGSLRARRLQRQREAQSAGGSLRARRLQRQQETQSSAVTKHEKQESKNAEQQRKVEMEKK